MGRLKKLEVEKGLLREVEGVSRLIGAVLKCKVISLCSRALFRGFWTVTD
jgi:hypothetical protein